MSKLYPRYSCSGAARALLAVLGFSMCAVGASAAAAAHTTPRPPPPVAAGVAAAPAPAAAASPAAATPAPMTGPQVIDLLDQTIDWYRTLGIQQQAANQPSDVLILYDNRRTASRVVALAFEIARANADILVKQPVVQSSGDTGTSSQTLAQLQSKFNAQGTAVKAELESQQHQLAKAPPKQRVELQAKVSELQGELDLIDARKSLLNTMSAFAGQSDKSGFSAGALKAQIDAMAVALPSAAD